MAQYVEVNGQNIEFPDGMAAGDIEAALKKNALSLPAAVSAGQAINANVSSIPRQLGLTARYGLEGLAQAAQVGTEPLRYLTDKFLPDRTAGVSGLVTGQAAPPKSTPLGVQATKFADWVGLPSPENANERVIGDAARLMAGAGGMGGAANAASRVPGMVGTVMTGLAANPTQQLASATGAGLAGGASREAGGNAWVQGGASLLGGIAGGLVPGGASAVTGIARRAVTPAMTPAQLDVQLSSVLERAGTDYSQLAPNVKNALRTEMAASLNAGADLSPEAVSRLAAFRSIPGATPTRGMISQNPVEITREMNLAKMGANSNATELQGLPLLQNQNNSALVSKLNALGGASEMDPITAGRLIQDQVAGRNASLQSAEKAAWAAARAEPGYKQPISNKPLHDAFKAVDDEGLIGFMPQEITGRLQAFMTGQQPFTPQEYRNLRSVLSRVASPENQNGNQRYAAGVMGRALDGAEMRPNTNMGGVDFGTAPVSPGLTAAMRQADSQPGSAIDAVDAARRATAAKYGYQESSPLVKAALGDGRTNEPENIAKAFILNGTVGDARSVAKEVGPQGMGTIRDTLATYIKKQAMSSASDETGKVSQSALNAVLRKIGDEKLGIFFSPEEVKQLKDTGRVASLMMNQPVGSAVNNSNSGALLLGRGVDALSKIPIIGPNFSPAIKNIRLSMSQNRAQDFAPGLLAPAERQSMGPSLLLPGLAVGGGLLSP
ncbi:hypothetical protein VLK31_34970 [Variovorax sp. H27-G14]|uniref:hypothetical protein n=1 Tax=Variovorax sp. H27-G14 TaxID=3111914 RepID=UPI0038FCD7E4